MSTLEAALRGAAIVLLLLRIVSFARSARRNQVSRYSALLYAGIAAYVVESAPDFCTLALVWTLPIHIIGCGAPIAFWLTLGTIFTDAFRVRWYHALAWGVLTLLGAAEMSGYSNTTTAAIHSALSVSFILLGIWHALAGRTADLVEGRRRLRLAFAVTIALYSVVIVVSEWLWSGGLSAAPLSLANAIGLTAFIFVFAVLGSAQSTEPRLVHATAQPEPTRSLDTEPRTAPSPTGPDATLLKALRRLIDHDKVYREPDLSIAALSQKLDIPEHRLRRLINQELGHRNFSAFVNGYRLAEAEAALADRGQAEVPILTIALDAGFGSIGPFNRAFKAHAGLTPSEYRRTRLGRAGDEPLPSPN